MKIARCICLIWLAGLFCLATGCSKDEETPAVKDADGNEYSAITIGTQTWMKENLKTTKYNDGSTITNHGSDYEWMNTTSGAYAWYENDVANKSTYGALYNGYAVSTDRLCPSGWHVPSRDEWLVLINYLGGVDFAGGKLKETGTTHWLPPNTAATDEYGFKALPGGRRDNTASFALKQEQGWWWSSTDNATNTDYSSHVYMDFDEAGASYYSLEKTYGLSVRCLKD